MPQKGGAVSLLESRRKLNQFFIIVKDIFFLLHIQINTLQQEQVVGLTMNSMEVQYIMHAH